MKKVGFYTLGCKVNQYETNAMIQLFEEAGFEIVDFDSYADIYVINTCTVTNMSDRKSRQFLRQAKKTAGEISLEECIGTDKEGNNMTFSDILPAEGDDISDMIALNVNIKKLYAAMEEYESGSSEYITESMYKSLKAGLETIHSIMGEEFDARVKAGE